MADESLLQVEAEPAWYEELMRLKDQGRVSMTPTKGLLRSNLATGAAAELANPPALNWDEDKYLELQKDRGKNLDRFLRFDFNSMQPGETFTKANMLNLTRQGQDSQELMSAYDKAKFPETAKNKIQRRIDELKRRPITLYHGSPKFEGSTFDVEKLQSRDHGFFGKGVYLTTSQKLAGDSYTRQGGKSGESPEVLPVYANIQNPFYLKHEVKSNDIENITKGLEKIAETLKQKIALKDSEGFYNSDDLYMQNILNTSINMFKGMLKDPLTKLPENTVSSIRVKQALDHLRDSAGIDMSTVMQASGYDSTIVGDGNEVIIYDPKRIKSMFNQGSYNPLVDDLNANLGLGSNYARRT